MATIFIRSRGATGLSQRFTKANAKIGAEVERGVERATILLERELKTSALRGQRAPSGLFRGGGVGSTLAVGTGAARASIVRAVFTKIEGLTRRVVGVVGSPLVYLAVHERGATIHGRPWLTIPTIYARRFQTIVRGKTSKSATLATTFFKRTKSGAIFLFGKTGKRGKAVPLFLLKHSVTLRPRRMFASTLDANRAAISSLMVRAVEAGVRSV